MKSVEIIDLTHTIRDGLVTYPGLPAPRMSAFLTHDESQGRYAPGVAFHIGRIEMVANTGTYVDAPFHRYVDRETIAGVPLERLAWLDGLVVDGAGAIGPDAFAELDVGGKAVLIRTGSDRLWGTRAYFETNPHLTEAGADALVRGGAALVGIDAVNIDSMADGARPAHSHLLAAGIPVVEHLANLGALPARGFRFFAVPAKVDGIGSFPVRAFALIVAPP